MSELFSYVGIIIASIFIYFLFIRKTRIDKILSTIHGPPILPLIGNLLEFYGRPEDTLDKVLALCQRYGPRIKIYIFGSYSIMLMNPEDVEKVLTSNVNIGKGGDYGCMKPWLGTGILLSEGEKWRTRRKMLTPTFHFKILEDFMPVFNDHALKLVKILKEESKNGKFDIFHHITRCTLDIICETAMGKKIDSLNLKDSEFCDATIRMGKLVQIRVLVPWYHPEFIWNLTSHSVEQKKVLRILHGFAEKVIQERKQQNAESARRKLTTEEDDGLQGKRKLAFLDLLLEEQQKNPQSLTDADIKEEVDNFMFGGHDTVAVSLSFTVFLLGCHPEVQAKVHQELDEIFGNDRYRPVVSQDLTKMKYIECVIRESLRLFPSAPLIQRWIQQDVVLNDGQIIPKGVLVSIPILDMHRSEELFPAANEFKPERFHSENNEKRRSPFAYIPFGAGSRNCMGQKFAMIEEKILLAHIFRHYTIKTEESHNDLKLLFEIVLRSHQGINVIVSSR